MGKAQNRGIVLPPEYITTMIISREALGVSLDFEVTFSIFGEVLSADPLFTDLPVAAWQFMYGPQDFTKVKVLAHYYAGEFSFALPLLAIDYLMAKQVPEWLGETWLQLMKQKEKKPDYIRFARFYPRPEQCDYFRMIWTFRKDGRYDDLAANQINRLLQLFSPEAIQRRTACRSLTDFGKGIEPFLRHRVNDPDEIVAKEAAIALGRLKAQNI